MSLAEQTAVVKQYCTGCHSERGKAGGLSLAAFDAAQVVDHADVTEKMIRKLRAGMMPPVGARRPDAATIAAMVDAFETRIDRAAAVNPNPGSRPSQRLNRAEYTRAVRDLLAIDVDVSAYLPPDTISDGFDNIADSQTISSTLMEGYLRAASQISRLAVGDRHASASSTTWKVPRTASQMRHVEGAPLGTRGGLSVLHVFPADGDYIFKIMLHMGPTGDLFGGPYRGEQIEVSINGDRVALMDINPRMNEQDPNGLTMQTPRIHITAGQQRISAAFVQRFEGPADDLIMPIEHTLADTNIGEVFGTTALTHLRDFTVTGPIAVTGVSDTESRRRVFVCRPTTLAEESTCAATIVRKLAGQAYRGPVQADDFKDLMAFYEKGRKEGDFETGIRMAVQAILASPRFLFRLERTPATLKAGQNYRVSDYDLASRLSFFLWGSVPDAELLKVASQGTLQTPAVFDRQLKRMLADPRSEALAVALRLAVAAPAGRRQGPSRSSLLLLLGHDAVEGDGPRDRAVRRQPDSRGSSGHRPADRRPHLRQRAARQALRHSEHPRRRIPARDDCRSESPRRARTGQRAAADLDRRSHLGGAARQVGDGSAARLAAAAAAAQRAVARRNQGGRRPASCSRRASAWKSIARTRRAPRATR